MIKLRNKNIIRKGPVKDLTVVEGFITFAIALNHVPPRPKREKEFVSPLMGTLAHQRGPSLAMNTSFNPKKHMRITIIK
jgi:hypothetical protein